MRGVLGVAASLIMTCHAAFADAVVECNQPRWSKVRIAACTEIIEGSNFGPSEKAHAYISRGNARTDAGAVQSAMADFTAALRLQKDNSSAFAGRGRAKFIWGNWLGAIDDYSEAIRLLPSSAALYTDRGHIYTAARKIDAAIGDLTTAIRLNPQSDRAFDERGLAYFKRGDLERAIEDFTAAIAIIQAPDYYASRGHVYEVQGDKLKAIEDYQYALWRDPSLVAVRDALRRLGAEQEIFITTERRIRAGATLAEKNCASCHAIGATGVSPNKGAPAFRNLYRRHSLFALRQPITQGVIQTHDQMPQFLWSIEQIDLIVTYINSLSTPHDNN